MLFHPLKYFWVLSCALTLAAASAAEPAAKSGSTTASQTASKVAATGAPELRPLSDYRYHNDRVKLEKLEDKGLTYEKVRPAKPIEPGRPRPPAPFSATSRKPGKAGSAAAERVAVQLLEEAGVARSPAAVSFGFPLPQGALFDLGGLRLVGSDGREIAAQFTATSFWPDDSLKWVLIDCAVGLTARQALDCAVEFGSQVKRGPAASPLKVEANAASITVVTGPLKVELDKQRFHLFGAVWLDANHDGRFADDERVAASGPEGVLLIDQNGQRFTMSGRPPESVRIEEQGPQKVVVRVEGPYAAADGETYMRYIARLVFRAGSPRVDVAITHVNDYLKTEFTDITSLSAPIELAGGLRQAVVPVSSKDGKPVAHQGRAVSVVQLDERTCAVRADAKASQGGRAPGTVSCIGPRGTMVVAVHDFWQRWPKALSTDSERLRIELLPKQPDANYGKGLPHYLFYPFVEGFYRFKWGMSFTERISFDFSGRMAQEELAAEANSAVVPVLPPEWYAKTNALGLMAVPMGSQFAVWDKYLDACYQNYLQVRDNDRTYGYLNYGDWYGERGRNWGNNEYDLAHGYFMQFARSGNRDYFRLALTAARHQADVDCVHAYPDPYYVGSNHQHSIGHTGTWSQNPRYATWTHRYDSHTSAGNGHTWAEGMLDAWFLVGEAPVMESALALTEHITWAMAPAFKALGTHERSAGWSLKAIMAAYCATYDPLYLEAARRLAAVALAEQKFDDGGAWPHKLPKDHAGAHPGARGNAVFLIAILLAGLEDYHLQTNDPAVAKSIVSGARWLLRCWNEEAQGWPYTASPSGEPYFEPRPGLMMAVGPLAYAGHLTGEARFLEVAEAGLGSTIRAGATADGKSIAQKMIFTSSTLAFLHRWYAAHCKDKGATRLSDVGDDLAQYLAKTHDAQRHSVRGPTTKVFLVRLRSSAQAGPVTASLCAVRKPHGAMAKRDESGTIQVLGPAGAVVKEGRFSTDGPYEFQAPLRGEPGEAFKVVVKDDLRSVWSLAGEQIDVLMQTGSGFSIGSVGRGRYHFFVPQGTKQFRVDLAAGHHGRYAGVVISPSGKIAGFHEGIKVDRPASQAEPKKEANNRQELSGRGTITVQPDADDTGKVWSLVLMAGGDINCQLQGVPPYLTLRAEECAGRIPGQGD